MDRNSFTNSFSEPNLPGEDIKVMYDGLLLAASGVLKVHYGNNKLVLLQFNENTTAEDAVFVLCEQLDCKDFTLYSLVLTSKDSSPSETMKKRRKVSSDDVILPSWDALAKVVNDPSMQHYECHLRITFLNEDNHKMSLEDHCSLKYLFDQCVNDVLAGAKYSYDLPDEDVLKLASLQMLATVHDVSEDDRMTSNNNHLKRTTDGEDKLPFSPEALLKLVENNYGLKNFLPSPLLEDMQSDNAQNHRIILQHHIQAYYSVHFEGADGNNVSPPDQQSCNSNENLLLRLQTEYIKLFLSSTSYGDWYFNANILSCEETDATLVVGCRHGISKITESQQEMASIFPNFTLIQSIEVAPCSSGSIMTQVKIDVKEEEPLLLTMKPQCAFNLACLVDGYCRMYNNDDIMLIMPTEIPTSDCALPYAKSLINNGLNDGDCFSEFSDEVISNLLSTSISDCTELQEGLSKNENKLTGEAFTDPKFVVLERQPSSSENQSASLEGSLSKSERTSQRSSSFSSESSSVEHSSSIHYETQAPSNTTLSLQKEGSDGENQSDGSEILILSSTDDKTMSKRSEPFVERTNLVEKNTSEDNIQISVADSRENKGNYVDSMDITSQDISGDTVAERDNEVPEVVHSSENERKKSNNRFSWFKLGTLPRSKSVGEPSRKSREGSKRASFFRNFFSPKRSYSVGKEMETQSFTTDATSTMPRSESGFGRKWRFSNFFKSSPSPSKPKSTLSLSRKKRDHTLFDSDGEDQIASQPFSGFYSLFQSKKHESSSAASRNEVDDLSSAKDLHLKLHEETQSASVLHSSQSDSDTRKQASEEEKTSSISSKSTSRSSVAGSIVSNETSEDELENGKKVNSTSSLASEEIPVEAKHSPRGDPPAKPPRLYYQLSSSSTADEPSIDTKDTTHAKDEDLKDIDQKAGTAPILLEDEDIKSPNQGNVETETAAKERESQNHREKKNETDDQGTIENFAEDSVTNVDGNTFKKTAENTTAHINSDTIESIEENSKTEADERKEVSDNEGEVDIKLQLDHKITDDDDHDDDKDIETETLVIGNSPSTCKSSTDFEVPQVSEYISEHEEEEREATVSNFAKNSQLVDSARVEEKTEALDMTDANEPVREADAESKDSLDEKISTSSHDSTEVSTDSDSIEDSSQFLSKTKENNFNFQKDVPVTSNLSESSTSKRSDNDFKVGRSSSIESLEQHNPVCEKDDSSASKIILNRSESSDSSSVEASRDQELSLVIEKAAASPLELQFKEEQVPPNNETKISSVESSQSSTSEDTQKSKNFVSSKPPLSPKPAFLSKVSVLKVANKLPSTDVDHATEKIVVNDKVSLVLSQENSEPTADVLNRLLVNGFNSSEEMLDTMDSGHSHNNKNQQTDNQNAKLESSLFQNNERPTEENLSQKVEIGSETQSLSKSSSTDESDEKISPQTNEDCSTYVNKQTTTELKNSSKSTFLSGSFNLAPNQPTIAVVNETKQHDISIHTENEVFDFPPPPEEFNISFVETSMPEASSLPNQEQSDTFHENTAKSFVENPYESSHHNLELNFGRKATPNVFKSFTPIGYKSPNLLELNQSGPDKQPSTNQPNQTYHSLIAPRLFGQQREVKTFSKIKPPTPAAKNIKLNSASQ